MGLPVVPLPGRVRTRGGVVLSARASAGGAWPLLVPWVPWEPWVPGPPRRRLGRAPQGRGRSRSERVRALGGPGSRGAGSHARPFRAQRGGGFRGRLGRRREAHLSGGVGQAPHKARLKDLPGIHLEVLFTSRYYGSPLGRILYQGTPILLLLDAQTNKFLMP